MIISFAFSNFRSFRGEATLSLEAHLAHKGKADALIEPTTPLPRGAQLLGCAAIYGANASGKSNVLQALEYMRTAVVDSHSSWMPDGSTLSQPHMVSLEEPARFEIELISNGSRYRYGFSATLHRFTSEWLYTYSSGRQRRLYERTSEGSNAIEVTKGRSMSGSERDLASSKRRTRDNSLFLSVAAQENQRECLDVWSWFKNNLNTRDMTHDSDDHAFTNRICDEDKEMKYQILQMMQGADSSLVDIEVKKGETPVSIEDRWTKELSPELKKFVAENRSYSVRFAYSHEGDRYYIPLQMQSAGSKRLHALASTIACVLKYGEVLVIDELEASLHSHISAQLVALFQNRSTNPNGAQLIFTTHDVNLLASDLLRRDQVWFVDKQDGESALYSLLEFKPRRDESLFQGYLRGRYGAIPDRSLSAAFLPYGGESE